MVWLAVLIFIVGSAVAGNTHDDIKMRLYSVDESYETWSLHEAGGLFYDEKYNSALDMVVIILGYDTDQDNMILQTVQALLSRKLNEKYNIVAVDLPQQFSFDVKNFFFIRPAINVQSVGEALGDFINAAFDAGFITPAKINVVGFSLGAQIAGYLGRRVNGLIHSITGVDPSGIGFDWSSPVTGLAHVSSDDAQFVHLYHSNSAVFGTQKRLGTADYMFNTGETQPGCNSLLDPFCSHMRGFYYYVEALRITPGLPALQCNNHSHLDHCKCQGHKLSYVGFPPDISAKGLFVLRTGDKPAYSLGKNGITGTKCKSKTSNFDFRMVRHYNAMMHMLKERKSDEKKHLVKKEITHILKEKKSDEKKHLVKKDLLID